MYTPTHFEENRIEVLHELIRTHPLASLITHSESGLNANHFPLHLKSDPESHASPEGALSYGILCGHMARANPLWQEVSEESEVLAIFHGPQSYITPSWYASKEETGKVVPTWNYAVVHAYGSIRIIEDSEWENTGEGNDGGPDYISAIEILSFSSTSLPASMT